MKRQWTMLKTRARRAVREHNRIKLASIVCPDVDDGAPMPSWTVDVTKVEKLNESVNRIVADEIVVDVLTRFLECEANERINLALEHNSAKVKGSVRMCGIVLSSQDNMSIVSCGGLMCRVPMKAVVNDRVFVGVAKSRRRRRE